MSLLYCLLVGWPQWEEHIIRLGNTTPDTGPSSLLHSPVTHYPIAQPLRNFSCYKMLIKCYCITWLRMFAHTQTWALDSPPGFLSCVVSLLQRSIESCGTSASMATLGLIFWSKFSQYFLDKSNTFSCKSISKRMHWRVEEAWGSGVIHCTQDNPGCKKQHVILFISAQEGHLFLISWSEEESSESRLSVAQWLLLWTWKNIPMWSLIFQNWRLICENRFSGIKLLVPPAASCMTMLNVAMSEWGIQQQQLVTHWHPVSSSACQTLQLGGTIVPLYIFPT